MGSKIANKMLLGGAALIALGTASMAADMPVKAPAFRPAATYNWTGFFTGSSIGGQSWDISGIYATPPNDRHNTEGTKGIYGSHIGAQYQVNSWVLGVEAAFTSPFDRAATSSFSPNVVTPGADCLGATPVPDRRCSSRVNSVWTVGGRLGYTWDRWMVFGSGGYANGRVDTAVTVASTGAPTSATSARQDGWFAGAGAEYFVTKFLWSDLILGAEYQHIDLGTTRHLDNLTGSPLNTRDMKATEDLARARVIFKWTPDSPAR